MNALPMKVVIGTVGLITFVLCLLFVSAHFRPELILTDRGVQGMKFCLRARMMNLAFDAGMMNVNGDDCRTTDIRAFVAARNGSKEGFWVSGKKYDVQYKLNANIDAWTYTGVVDWIVEAQVSCSTNLIFRMYSNLDVLPMTMRDDCTVADKKYERFLLRIGGLSAFEAECDNAVKNESVNDSLTDIPVSPRLAALGVQELRIVHDNSKTFLIIFLDKDKSSGFISLQKGDSQIELDVHFMDVSVIRLDERIWWFDETQMAFDDEAYLLLHGNGRQYKSSAKSYSLKKAWAHKGKCQGN